MRHVGAEEIKAALPFERLIPELLLAAKSKFIVPQRSILQVQRGSKLLTMPASQYRSRLGVKLISVYEGNRAKNIETIQGVYCLFDSETGSPLMTLDAGEITARRTAAASALAADMLARPSANQVAIAGDGRLLPYFIEAYKTVRPKASFRFWARNSERLTLRQSELESIAQSSIKISETFQEAVSGAHIVSTITSSRQPILLGAWLESGMHIDLVGAHTEQMSEADPDCFVRARIFVDSREAALEEAGDLLAALRENRIGLHDITGDLFDLATERVKFTREKDDITLFKSVGHAFEDLVAAVLVEEYFKESKEP